LAKIAMAVLSPAMITFLTISAAAVVTFVIYLRVFNKGFILKGNSTSGAHDTQIQLKKSQRNKKNILKLRFYKWFEYDKIEEIETALKVGDYYVVFEPVTVQDIKIFYGQSSPLEVNIMVTAENNNHFGTLARSDFIKYMDSQSLLSGSKNTPPDTMLDPVEIVDKVRQYVEDGVYPKGQVASVGEEYILHGLKQPALVFFKSGEDIIVVPYVANDIISSIRTWLEKVPIEMEDKLISKSIDEYLSSVLSKES